MSEYPRLLQTVLDATDARSLAEFYRQLLGVGYRPGDEVPASGEVDEADWLVLLDQQGGRRLAFQQVDRLTPTTWPGDQVPMQLHLDLTVASPEQLERQRHRAEGLGARMLLDRTDDPEEPLYVFADPAGHPFCIFVALTSRVGPPPRTAILHRGGPARSATLARSFGGREGT